MFSRKALGQERFWRERNDLVLDVDMPCSRQLMVERPLGCRCSSSAILLLILLFLIPGLTLAQEGELSGSALVAAVRTGGYNLYFRHGATVWSQSDQVERESDWVSCDPKRVRQLSESGRHASRLTGKAMREAGLPIGQVYASPYCRTVQTAEEMGLGQVIKTTDVMNLRVADLFGGRDSIVATARLRLGSSPRAGFNNVYVAHGNVAVEATGVYPDEGEMLVFRPLGGERFSFVGRIKTHEWPVIVTNDTGIRP